MMANWNLPTLTSQYDDFLTEMKALAEDAATMFSASPTNTPTGAIRYNRTTDKVEEWSGAAWAEIPLSVALLKLSGTSPTIYTETSDGSDNAVVQIGHPSATRGAFLAVAGNEQANTGLAYLCAGNVAGAQLLLECPGAHPIRLKNNGALKFEVDTSGNFVPGADNSYEIGSSSLQIKDLHIKRNTWTPSFTVVGTGSPTITSTSILQARYTKKGTIYSGYLEFTGTLGGTTVTEVRATLPATAGYQARAISYYYDGGAERRGWTIVDASTNIVRFLKEDLTSGFTLGASKEFAVHFEIETA